MLLVKYSKQLQKILSNSLKNTGVNNYEIVSTTIPVKLINVLFFSSGMILIRFQVGTFRLYTAYCLCRSNRNLIPICCNDN